MREKIDLGYIKQNTKLKGFETLEQKANKLKLNQGLKIASLMKEKSVSLSMLVEATKVGKSTIIAIKRGRSNYAIDSYNKLKVYLENCNGV